MGSFGKLCLEPLQDDGKVSVSDFLDKKFYDQLFALLGEGKELVPHMAEIRGEISEIDAVEMVSLVHDFVDMVDEIIGLMDQAKKLKGG